MPPKRLKLETACAILIDAQEYFLSSLEAPERAYVEQQSRRFLSLVRYLQIPIVVTLERPVEKKGGLPASLSELTDGYAQTLEKDFFDLTAEPGIKGELETLARKQVIMAGCETDVCVLQSCLGLLALGYEVFVVEDLLFSSSDRVGSAVERMKAEGCVFFSLKSLFHKLMQAIESGPHRRALAQRLGPLPKDLKIF